MKRISAEAYQALRDAIPVITWNKRPFETLLKTALRENTELLSGLNFNEPKRIVADALVDRLVRFEDKYQDVTLRLMLEIANLNNFPNVEQIKDPDNREQRLNEAKVAISHLRLVTKSYASYLSDKEKQNEIREANVVQAITIRRFNTDIENLRDKFIVLQNAHDVHARGYALEVLLADLFLLYDLEPRLSYKIELEQIDGSFTFETDDYVVEARWRAEQCDRADGDVFKAKVESKGKNALGLFVSVNGFKSTFLERFKEGTPFITIDGNDLYSVLDNRIRLDDLLRAKKRHANETGSCHLPVNTILMMD